MIPQTMIDAWVFDARAVVLNPLSRPSLVALAWRVLRRWGAR